MKTEPLSDGFGTLVVGQSGELNTLNREAIIELLKTTAVVVFRGFDASLEQFNAFTDAYSTDYMTYRGGGYIRKQVGDGSDETLLSVNYDHARGKQDTFGLPLHGEMYYAGVRPTILWFYCVVPAEHDGETTICDGSKIYAALKPETRKLLEEKKLKYIRQYLDGEWQKVYQTDVPDEAVEFAASIGVHAEFKQSDQSLHTQFVHPGIITSRWNGHKVYTNNLLTVMWQEVSLGRKTSIVRFEDGSKVPMEIIDEVRAVQAKLVIPIKWAHGDFAVLDNTRALHGRREFSDPRRDLYLRMVRSVDF